MFNRHKTPTVPGKTFDLTDTGRALVVSVDQGSGGFGKSTRLRIADYQVNEITLIGDAAEINGSVVSQITYSYSSHNHHTLADSTAIQDSYPIIKKQLGSTLEGKTHLIKTNKGWVHEKLMNTQK